MNLSEVSQTAVLALICRIVESEKDSLFDTQGGSLFGRLMTLSSEQEKRRILRLWKPLRNLPFLDFPER